MRKISIWLLLIIAVTGCKKNPDEVIVKGEIKGLRSDTVYIYGVGALYDRTDTILAEKGKFSSTLKPDTTSIAALLFDQQVYPIFLEKGKAITIKGSADGDLEIKGNSMNEEYTAFRKELEDLERPSEMVAEEKAETYILTHPSSFVSVYLLDRYFVQKENPNTVLIKKLMGTMTGLLQDAPYIQTLTKQIEQIENTTGFKMIPFFSLPNLKGERISRNEKFENKYLIIHFWASWCDECKEDFAALRQINRTYLSESKKNKTKKKNDPIVPEKKGIGILSISLDTEKSTWQDAVKQDSLTWEQVNESQGFNSDLIKQFGIQKIPATFLVSPEGRIIRRDISADSIRNILPDYPLEKKH